MKRLIYPLMAIMLFTSCENESITNEQDALIGTTLKGINVKVDVCHKGKIINISSNALNAHLNHGDVALIDNDGDGYIVAVNECGILSGDCDDMDAAINPGAEEICDNGIDDNCNGETDEGCEETEGVFRGAGGKEYKWVKIGNQIWMAENVAYEGYSVNFALYRGGIADYAHLYTWEDAMTNCCSDGWHLPSDAEWTELSTFLIENGYGYGGSGDDIAQSLSALSYWGYGLWPGSPRYGGHDDSLLNNTSGFSALPAGYGYKPDGDFYEYPTPDNLDQIFTFPAGDLPPGIDTHWWSSTEHGTDGVYARTIFKNDPEFSRSSWNRRTFVFSVRCVKD